MGRYGISMLSMLFDPIKRDHKKRKNFKMANSEFYSIKREISYVRHSVVRHTVDTAGSLKCQVWHEAQ